MKTGLVLFFLHLLFLKYSVFPFLKAGSSFKPNWSCNTPKERKNFFPYLMDMWKFRCFDFFLMWATATVTSASHQFASFMKETDWSLLHDCLCPSRSVITCVSSHWAILTSSTIHQQTNDSDQYLAYSYNKSAVALSSASHTQWSDVLLK